MKFFLSGLILILFTQISTALENPNDEVPSVLVEESDFQTLGRLMQEKSLGLVLMLHAENCPYCYMMEHEILSPMVRSKDYDDKVLIRKLQIDEARDIKDFSGKVVEPSDLSDRYGATLTPTLVFLDAQGNEKTEKMIGINTVELFGAYLDRNIDKLVKNIKN